MFGYTRSVELMKFFGNAKRGRRHESSCGSVAHSVSVLGWWKCYFAKLSRKTEQKCEIYSAIGRRKATFSNTIQNRLNYTQEFPKDHAKRLVDVCITDIANKMISSNVLAADSIATYVRYIRVGRMMIERKYGLSLLTDLGKETPAANALGTTHPDNSSPYILYEDEVLLMNQAANVFVRNDHKLSTFHEIDFNAHTRETFKGLDVCH